MNKNINLLTSKFQKESERLVIRPLKNKDFNKWEIIQKKILINNGNFDSLYPKEKINQANFEALLKKNIQLMKKDKGYFWGIFLKENNEYIGEINLIVTFRVDIQSAYLGYEIFQNYRKKGFGKEAVNAIIEVAFDDLKFHRIEAGIELSNKASINLVESLGMRNEGIHKKYVFNNDKWNDMVVYVLTAEDLGIKQNKPEIRSEFNLDNL